MQRPSTSSTPPTAAEHSSETARRPAVGAGMPFRSAIRERNVASHVKGRPPSTPSVRMRAWKRGTTSSAQPASLPGQLFEGQHVLEIAQPFAGAEAQPRGYLAPLVGG